MVYELRLQKSEKLICVILPPLYSGITLKRGTDVFLLMAKYVAIIITMSVVCVGCVSAATHHVNPGESIQAAINNATAGDTIFVYSGTYDECNILVNKQLILRGVDTGGGKPFVDGGYGAYVFAWPADGMRFEGFSVRVTSYFYPTSAAIIVSGDNATIIDNDICGEVW
jgi:hypothetical protein